MRLDRLGLAAAFAAALAGCDSSQVPRTVAFDLPVSVAVFTGITSKSAELRPYVAVANGGRDDLTLVDAVDRQPVLAPVLVRALAVPTVGRPARLVSGDLHDGKPDLLAVVPAGGGSIQVVRTWSADNRTVPALEADLGVELPGAEVLSAVSLPVVDGSGVPEPGRVRLVLGLSGGRLGVLEFARETSGDGIVRVGATIAVRDVGFEPVALASSPVAGFAYAATPDDLPAGSGRFGVVEVDARGAPAAWAVDMLDARGPTRLVAAAFAAERDFTSSRVDIPVDAPYVVRVVADLDPLGCGPERAIECGVVTLDPSPGVRGVLADPLGELPYQPPIQLPAEVLAMAAAIPPSVPQDTYEAGRMRIQTGVGERKGAGVVEVVTANGRAYSIDLARRTILNDQTMLRNIPNTDSQTRTRAAALSFFERAEPLGQYQQVLPLVSCEMKDDVPECKLDTNVFTATSAIRVTPGYTRDDALNISWQGILPGLSQRDAVAFDDGGLVVALQLRTPTGFSQFARLADPALGVRVGDTVELAVNDLDPADPGDACDVPDDPATPTILEDQFDVHEYAIVAILAPDPVRFPGGAVRLQDDGSACQAALRGGAVTGLFANVRAAGWLMRSELFGYAGRPVTRTAPDELDRRVVVDWVHEDEQGLTCPLSPWPERPDLVACDEACRATCERLLLARKARRWYTVPDTCAEDTACSDLWSGPIIDPDPDNDPATDDAAVVGQKEGPPNARGPAVSFQFTVREIDRTTRAIREELPVAVNRGTGMVVTLASGHTPTSRYPTSGAIVLPNDLAPFDRSKWGGAPGNYRFFIAYPDDLVLDLSPAEPVNLPTTIR